MRLGVAEDFSEATDIVVKVYKHNGNCGYIELALQGAMIQAFDIAKIMCKFELWMINSAGHHAVKHEGVIGIG